MHKSSVKRSIKITSEARCTGMITLFTPSIQKISIKITSAARSTGTVTLFTLRIRTP